MGSRLHIVSGFITDSISIKTEIGVVLDGEPYHTLSQSRTIASHRLVNTTWYPSAGPAPNDPMFFLHHAVSIFLWLLGIY